MQLWSQSGTQCLFCTFRTLFTQNNQRFFTTSSPSRGQQLSKKIQKISRGPSRSIKLHDKNVELSSLITAALSQFKEELNAADTNPENWARFERNLIQASKLQQSTSAPRWGSLWQLRGVLQEAYLKSGFSGLKRELRSLYRDENITAKYSTPHLNEQKKVADLRYPAEWYPTARALQRTIHLHVGPTNSGKTYQALQRLRASKHGFYAGPLRLLAQEVYSRFNDDGIPCSLITGDDVRLPKEGMSRIVSNTVEMVNVGTEYEVGVIDEIQMIADPVRGSAWTRAVLGARAKELHLCGEARTVPLIQELVALTGDTLEIHHYERLNPLRVMNKSLNGDLRKLQKGDCLVAFSRLGIHALKSEVEKATGKRAAIVYGSLPAEIRKQQADLFNDPDNDYDFLVASDAIGMGLNLRCKRIIFRTLVKRTGGMNLSRLSIPEIKQIAGRAGRYRAANDKKGSPSEGDNIGLVTSLEEVDLPYIHNAMKFEPPPLTKAGVYPPDPTFIQFSDYFPSNVSLQYIITRLIALAEVHPLFFICNPQPNLDASRIIQAVDGLRVEDHLTFLAAPIYTRDPASHRIVQAFARCVAQHRGGGLLEIPELNLEILEQEVSGQKEYLHDLESLHRAIILYSWLSFRMGGVFTDRTMAAHVKELVEERMVRALTEFSANRKLRKDASLRRQMALQRQLAKQSKLLAMAGDSGGGDGSRGEMEGYNPYDGQADAENLITSSSTGENENRGDEDKLVTTSGDPSQMNPDEDDLHIDLSMEDSNIESESTGSETRT